MESIVEKPSKYSITTTRSLRALSFGLLSWQSVSGSFIKLKKIDSTQLCTQIREDALKHDYDGL